jgi:hypothetical protein
MQNDQGIFYEKDIDIYFEYQTEKKGLKRRM